jgi:hypothetical protein
MEMSAPNPCPPSPLKMIDKAKSEPCSGSAQVIGISRSYLPLSERLV